MSRLLFAAARGARMQLKLSPQYEWQKVHSAFIPVVTTNSYRIHPEDKHLQYGPISTALREMAPVDVNVRPLAWRRVSNICGEVRGVFETQDVELRSERLEPLFGVAEIAVAAHDAVVRALDEAGIRNDVLRGMCIEVAIEKLRDVLRPNKELSGQRPKGLNDDHQ